MFHEMLGRAFGLTALAQGLFGPFVTSPLHSCPTLGRATRPLLQTPLFHQELAKQPCSQGMSQAFPPSHKASQRHEQTHEGTRDNLESTWANPPTPPPPERHSLPQCRGTFAAGLPESLLGLIGTCSVLQSIAAFGWRASRHGAAL